MLQVKYVAGAVTSAAKSALTTTINQEVLGRNNSHTFPT
jgi:hypothetical protein